jgi:hypothetical protein
MEWFDPKPPLDGTVISVPPFTHWTGDEFTVLSKPEFPEWLSGIKDKCPYIIAVSSTCDGRRFFGFSFIRADGNNIDLNAYGFVQFADGSLSSTMMSHHPDYPGRSMLVTSTNSTASVQGLLPQTSTGPVEKLDPRHIVGLQKTFDQIRKVYGWL